MTIDSINHAIVRARNHDSGLDASVLEVPGFSTGVMRRLWNNLAADAKAYLEVGAYFGGTACAAINNNPELKAHFFEDGSQEFHGRPILDELRGNLKKHGSNYALSTDDFFDSDASIKGWPEFDFYFYDGEHSEKLQSLALIHAIDSLADKFLFAVDDFNWDSVRRGTERGFVLTQHLVDIVDAWHLRGQKLADDPVWHNGVALYLCKKCPIS